MARNLLFKIAGDFLAILGIVAAIWATIVLGGLYQNPVIYPLAHGAGEGALKDFNVGCVAALVLGWGVFTASRFWHEGAVIRWAWIAKIAVCLGVMMVYERVYPSLDAYGYFLGARVLAGKGFSSLPTGQGTYLIPELCAWVFQFIPVSYHAAKVICAGLGFTGVWFFYEALARAIGHRSQLWAGVLFLFPPVLFWGSILGKDPLMLFLLGLFTWLVFYFFFGRWYLLAAMAAFYVGVKTGVIREWAPKIYLPAFLFAGLVWGRPNWRISPGVRFLIMLSAGLMVVLGPGWWHLSRWLPLQRDSLFYYRRVLTMGGSAEGPPFPLEDWVDFILYVPYGMFSSLFRPLPLEVPNGFGLATGLINFALLLVVVCALLFGVARRRALPGLGFVASTCVIWAIIYGFISPANMGMGARFQLQVLPFLLMLVAMLFDGSIRRPGMDANAEDYSI